MSKERLHLLTLPYDIRHLIYEHVFPPGKQIYLQALPTRLISITPEHTVPMALLRTCEQLHAEAGEYLYNNYLFNIVGRKHEVIALYEGFFRTMEKYARSEVHIHPFSNGKHSATMCVSLHAGDGNMDTVIRRNRGVATKLFHVQEEIGYYDRLFFHSPFLSIVWRRLQDIGRQVLIIIGLSLGVAYLAWYLSIR